MALKFHPKPLEAEIPFLNDSKIKVKQLTSDQKKLLKQEAESKGIEAGHIIGDYIIERYIVGWEGIEIEETGKPLPFTDEYRALIFEEIKKDDKAAKELLVFVGGNLGN